MPQEGYTHFVHTCSTDRGRHSSLPSHWKGPLSLGQATGSPRRGASAEPFSGRGVTLPDVGAVDGGQGQQGWARSSLQEAAEQGCGLLQVFVVPAGGGGV